MKPHSLLPLLLLVPALCAAQREEGTESGADAPLPAQSAESVQATPAQSTAPETPKPTTTPGSLSWLGQDFMKIPGQAPGPDGSACDQYVPVGESAEDWSQLVAVQRLPGDRPAELLAMLRGKAGLTLSQAEHTDKGQLCHVRVGEGMDEHVGVVLATVDRNGGGKLILIAYLTKPARVDATKLNLQLEAWRNSLLRHDSGNLTRRTK